MSTRRRKDAPNAISQRESDIPRALPGVTPWGARPPSRPGRLPLSRPTPGEDEQDRSPRDEDRSPGVQPTAGRSGRTPAERYPPDGGTDDIKKGPYRPAANHPRRRTFLTGKTADISNGG